MRIVHYLNQFFGGIGGEEVAGTPLEEKLGAVGPGCLFEQVMGGSTEVVFTLICGDNYAVENQEELVSGRGGKGGERPGRSFYGRSLF